MDNNNDVINEYDDGFNGQIKENDWPTNDQNPERKVPVARNHRESQQTEVGRAKVESSGSGESDLRRKKLEIDSKPL